MHKIKIFHNENSDVLDYVPAKSEVKAHHVTKDVSEEELKRRNKIFDDFFELQNVLFDEYYVD